MFFRRTSKVTSAGSPEHPGTGVAEAAPPPVAENAGHARDRSLGFTTTADLVEEPSLPGEIAAQGALERVLRVPGGGLHAVVCGPAGSGKRTAVRRALAKVRAGWVAPSDWVYVARFDDASRPRALALPTGRARGFARDVALAVDDLREALPAAFASDDYMQRKRAIEGEARARHEESLGSLIHKAAAQNIAVLATPTGYTLAPMHEGKVVKPHVFADLPETMRKEVEGRISVLENALSVILAVAPAAERERRRRLQALDGEVALREARRALEPVRQAMTGLPDVLAHVDRIEGDVERHAGLFIADAKSCPAPGVPVDAARNPLLRRYLVNVLSAHGEAPPAPVWEAESPAPGTLAGRLTAATGREPDFLDIRPGGLHRANGGVLVLDARRLLADTASCDWLDRALASGKIAIDCGGSGLEPDPVPLALTIILVADADNRSDPLHAHAGLARHFASRIGIEGEIKLDEDGERAVALLIAVMARELKSSPLNAAAVSCLIDDCRKRGQPGMLALDRARLAGLIRAAALGASQHGRDVVGSEDVEETLKALPAHADPSP